MSGFVQPACSSPAPGICREPQHTRTQQGSGQPGGPLGCPAWHWGHRLLCVPQGKEMQQVCEQGHEGATTCHQLPPRPAVPALGLVEGCRLSPAPQGAFGAV